MCTHPAVLQGMFKFGGIELFGRSLEERLGGMSDNAVAGLYAEHEMAADSDTEFTARVSTKVGPVKARFSGKVTLMDIDPPNGYRIAGEGQGGVAGFAKGSAVVKLTDDGEDTLLNYDADAQVGGKLAQLGSRLIAGTARKTADDFFRNFAEKVGGAEAEGGTSVDTGGGSAAG